MVDCAPFVAGLLIFPVLMAITSDPGSTSRSVSGSMSMSTGTPGCAAIPFAISGIFKIVIKYK